MSYFFSEAARVEHLEHVAYYEEQRHGLGARYLATLLPFRRQCSRSVRLLGSDANFASVQSTEPSGPAFG